MEKEKENITNSEIDKNNCADILESICLVLGLLATFIPIFAFLVFSILSFDSEYKIYFILVFIFQGLFIIIMIIFNILNCIGCFDDNDDDYDYDYEGRHSLFPPRFIKLMFGLMIGSCIYIGMEIAILVFFIKFFWKLKLLAKVGYIAHWAFFCIPLMFSICRGSNR